MITRLTRRERLLVGFWVVLAAIAGNGLYDVLVTRGIKEYLFRYALHAAGRGPEVPLQPFIGIVVHDAFWVGLLWGSIILLAGMVTIRMMRPRITPTRPS